MKVALCTPSLSGPTPQYVKALEDSIPLILEAGWEETYIQEIGCPYISSARATMTRKALDAKADVIIYLDYDLSWDAQDLLTILKTDGDVVAGTYRFKQEKEEYMGSYEQDAHGRPKTRLDGCIKAIQAPAGFLKVTKEAVAKFMTAYPELVYGPPYNPSIDLFNHGAHKGLWYGEDYAFCRNWRDAGGDVWIVPNLNINHHSKDTEFKGNYHEYLLRLPGGSESDNPNPPKD